MGLIPAHAGKTRAPFWHSACQAAHPRSRGENTTRPRPRRKGWGSSPLTRGKLSFLWCVVSDERLIPAHAGKTSSRWCLSLSCPAHPRSRGENPHPMARQPCRRLAHPRSRGENVEDAQAGDLVCWLIPAHAGKTGVVCGSPGGVGLIPAHAGKTRLSRSCMMLSSAHPRSRGEN